MIVNPYNELISLHDMRIMNIEIEEETAYVYLDQAFMYAGKDDYILDNPVIIIHDIIDIEQNKDYPVRIRLIDDDDIITPTIADFNTFDFDILEEAYGFGLVHFYGVASQVVEDDAYRYDCLIDIHYSGDLELKWDDKKLVEV